MKSVETLRTEAKLAWVRVANLQVEADRYRAANREDEAARKQAELEVATDEATWRSSRVRRAEERANSNS